MERRVQLTIGDPVVVSRRDSVRSKPTWCDEGGCTTKVRERRLHGERLDEHIAIDIWVVELDEPRPATVVVQSLVDGAVPRRIVLPYS